MSTTWLFLFTELLVFRGVKPGTRRWAGGALLPAQQRGLLARLPLLALLVEALAIDVVVANVITLVLLFLVRFVIADAAIYGAERAPQPAREPMRIGVDVSKPVPDALAPRVPAQRSGPTRNTQRHLQYRYSIPDAATIGSQVRLPELEHFRAQHLGQDNDIQIRVAPTGDAQPRTRATMTQMAFPPSVRYSEHLGRLGANFHVELGPPILVTVARPLAHSPHVVYISAETDTGKTGTVLRMVCERGARFLSDDMTIVHPDGRVRCFPKPLTISHHTLRAVGSEELSRSEWWRLKLQSRLHSKEGRQFAMLLARLNIPIMGVNALTQRVVPPPKYTVDRLLRCTIIPSTKVSELFLISRGPHDAGELSRADADEEPAGQHRGRLPVPAVQAARPVDRDQ